LHYADGHADCGCVFDMPLPELDYFFGDDDDALLRVFCAVCAVLPDLLSVCAYDVPLVLSFSVWLLALG
jgi:hypothetical protein